MSLLPDTDSSKCFIVTLPFDPSVNNFTDFSELSPIRLSGITEATCMPFIPAKAYDEDFQANLIAANRKTHIQELIKQTLSEKDANAETTYVYGEVVKVDERDGIMYVNIRLPYNGFGEDIVRKIINNDGDYRLDFPSLTFTTGANTFIKTYNTDALHFQEGASDLEDYKLLPLGDYCRKVLGWAEERQIISNSPLLSQFVKQEEEKGELCTGIAKSNIEKIADAIGDVCVTVTNFYGILGLPVADWMTEWYTDEATEIATGPKRAIVDLNKALATTYAYADKLNALGETRTNPIITSTDAAAFKKQLFIILDNLSKISHHHGLRLAGCFRYAWTNIRFRTGKVNADGIFVKEADLIKD